MNQLMENYARVIQDDQYEHLVNIYRYQTTHNDAISQKLIYSNVILVYQQEDGTEWKDVHPAVVRIEKFQKALNKV